MGQRLSIAFQYLLGPLIAVAIVLLIGWLAWVLVIDDFWNTYPPPRTVKCPPPGDWPSTDCE